MNSSVYSQTHCDKIALYVHWPFCISKCPYCDFNVHLNNREEDAVWIDAYVQAFRFYAEQMPGRELASIFFGGGTPSLMPPALAEKLIEAAGQYFTLSDDLEVTLEANPTSSEIQKFQDFRSAGVNRISIGIQSLRDEALQFLGRQHSAADGLKALEMARTIFPRFSFDLIYARPGQNLQDWEQELLEALQYAGGHLSLYELTIEENTPFYKRRDKGEFQMPDDERASDFFLRTFEIMKAHGLPAYEISNYAAAGQECRYNVMTWLYEDYIGIGPGAHGRVAIRGQKHASYEERIPGKWLAQVKEQGHGASDFDVLSARERFEESLIAGLRMNNGARVSHLESKSGLKFEEQVDLDFLERACEEGWVTISCHPDRTPDLIRGEWRDLINKPANKIPRRRSNAGVASARDDSLYVSLTDEGLLRYDAITRALLSG